MAKAVATLKERYEKLKLKEARLEADLAIRDCPELQQPIAEIILAYVDAKTAFEKYQLVAPLGPKKDRLEAAKTQLALWQKKLDDEQGTDVEASRRRLFYEGKRDVAEKTIKDICDPKFEKLKQKYEEALTSLQDTYTRLSPLFEEHRFKWEMLLPSVKEFLARKVGH